MRVGNYIVKVGDLIQYTAIGSEEKVFGIVLKDLGYNIEFGEQAVSVHWFDNDELTTERKNSLPDNYEVISEGR